MTTIAADRFTDALLTAWDSSDPYVATAEAGYLAEPDEDALRALCAETGDDYAVAEAEVMRYIRARVAQMS
jgi:hypothetical protein